MIRISRFTWFIGALACTVIGLLIFTSLLQLNLPALIAVALMIIALLLVLGFGIAWRFRGPLTKYIYAPFIALLISHGLTTIGMNYNQTLPWMWAQNLVICLFLVSGAILFIQMCFILSKRDVGVRFIGIGMLIVVWSALVLAASNKHFFQLIMGTIFKQGPMHNLLWLMMNFILWLVCLIPLAFLSFIRFTFIALREEFRDDP